MRINTEHGYLTPLHPRFAEDLFQLVHASRASLHRWLPWLSQIHSSQDLVAFIDKRLQEQALHLVICLEDDTVCGGLGFYQLDKHTKTATMGYWLGQDFAGQGIMVDALAAACRYGFNEAGLNTLHVRCPADNTSGRRVPERLGFVLDGVVAKAAWLGDQYVDHACFSLTKQAFLAGNGSDHDRTVSGL